MQYTFFSYHLWGELRQTNVGRKTSTQTQTLLQTLLTRATFCRAGNIFSFKLIIYKTYSPYSVSNKIHWQPLALWLYPKLSVHSVIENSQQSGLEFMESNLRFSQLAFLLTRLKYTDFVHIIYRIPSKNIGFKHPLKIYSLAIMFSSGTEIDLFLQNILISADEHPKIEDH